MPAWIERENRGDSGEIESIEPIDGRQLVTDGSRQGFEIFVRNDKVERVSHRTQSIVRDRLAT